MPFSTLSITFLSAIVSIFLYFKSWNHTCCLHHGVLTKLKQVVGFQNCKIFCTFLLSYTIVLPTIFCSVIASSFKLVVKINHSFVFYKNIAFVLVSVIFYGFSVLVRWTLNELKTPKNRIVVDQNISTRTG